jgi:crossover junction endodeoxyribonuclease RuvC
VIILGIDPGSVKTGYGLVKAEGRSAKLVEYGVIRTRSGEPFELRLATIYDKLTEIILRHQPQVAVVETIFVGQNAKNIQSVLKLGHARGVVLLAVSKGSLPLIELSPTDVKKSITGHGRADKLQIKKMVQVLLGMDKPAAEDASDALALALTHCFRGTPETLFGRRR